jgi:hypothetical protein
MLHKIVALATRSSKSREFTKDFAIVQVLSTLLPSGHISPLDAVTI